MKHILIFLFALICLKLEAQELKPTETEALLNVSVVNFDNKPQEGDEVIFVSTKDEKFYSGITGADGKFSILIPKGQKYKVQYKTFTSEQDYKTLDIPQVEGNYTFDYTLKIQPTKTYTLNNVFFDSGKSSLRKESYTELDELAEYMTRKKTTVIEIAGHTDNVGDAQMNQKLSEERANTVRGYLLKKKIAPERVTAKGYGDTQPVAKNDTPEGKQKNRRTEVRIIIP